MKLLLVATPNRTSRTGVTAHYNRLLAALTAAGHEVVLLTPTDGPFWAKKTMGALRRVAALFGTSGRIVYWELENFASLWLAVRRHRKQAFHLVHAQDVSAGAAASLALRRGVRSVVTCHFNDDPLTEYRSARPLPAWLQHGLARWYRFLFRQNDAFITVSDYIRQTSAFLRPAYAPCRVIHNGVVFPAFPPKADSKEFILLNIGTLESRKNQALLIEAAAELRARGVEHLKVWFLGIGPKRADWEALARQHHLDDIVCFWGYQSDVGDFLQRAALYVHTAVNESWGYSITEAIASGTPVLTLVTGGIPEQFADQDPGLLPPGVTAAQLADAILPYCAPEARHRLAARQRAFAQSRFNLPVMLEKHLTFYQSLTTGAPVGVRADQTLVEA